MLSSEAATILPCFDRCLLRNGETHVCGMMKFWFKKKLLETHTYERSEVLLDGKHLQLDVEDGIIAARYMVQAFALVCLS